MFYSNECDELNNDLRIIFENPKIIVNYTQTMDPSPWGGNTVRTIMRLNVQYSSFDLLNKTNGWNEPLLAELLDGQGRFMNREVSQALDCPGINCTYEIEVADFDSFIKNTSHLSRKIQDNKFRKAFELEPN